MSTKRFRCQADFTGEAPRRLSESPCDGLSGCTGTRASIHTSSTKRRRRSKLGVMVKPTRRRRAASSSDALFVHNHLRSTVADVRTRWGANSAGKAGSRHVASSARASCAIEEPERGDVHPIQGVVRTVETPIARWSKSNSDVQLESCNTNLLVIVFYSTLELHLV